MDREARTPRNSKGRDRQPPPCRCTPSSQKPLQGHASCFSDASNYTASFWTTLSECKREHSQAVLKTFESADDVGAHEREQLLCVICYEGVVHGVVCPAQSTHVICKDCFNKDVKEACSPNNVDAFRRTEKRIRCCMCAADAGGAATLFEVSQMMRHLDRETLAVYLKARDDMIESNALSKLELEYNSKIRQLEEQIAKMSAGREKQVQLHRKRAVEEILTLKCPRCNLAFLDFDGCFALSCRGCSCGFCAYCLKDCGNDAHRHVATCPHNIAPGKDVFGSMSTFERAQKERRTRLIKSFLAQEVEADLRNDVARSLHLDLQDLGIDIRAAR